MCNEFLTVGDTCRSVFAQGLEFENGALHLQMLINDDRPDVSLQVNCC